VCSVVKPRIKKLTTKHEGLVGQLAVEILLALHEQNDRNQLDIHNTRVRVNLASVLVRLNLERHDPADGEGRSVDPGQKILRHLFGLDATQLSDDQKRLIGELKKAVEKGNARERTAATMTLLKLCESESDINIPQTRAYVPPAAIIRTQLCEIDMLDVFISQLRRKDTALVAAYGLATCLNYRDMKEFLGDNEDLPKRIVGMLRLDYFDDAVGPVEGFQIFGDFMQHGNEPLL
ncbi:hypothetical protein EV363DRAFT_1098078, partial [Boletus edulis]